MTLTVDTGLTCMRKRPIRKSKNSCSTTRTLLIHFVILEVGWTWKFKYIRFSVWPGDFDFGFLLSVKECFVSSPDSNWEFFKPPGNRNFGFLISELESVGVADS